MLDSQGRLIIGKELCDKLNMSVGMEIVFVREGNFRYRIVPIKDLVTSDEIIVDSNRFIDAKYRISVPKNIRSNYTRHVDITYTESLGYVYLTFLALSEKEYRSAKS